MKLKIFHSKTLTIFTLLFFIMPLSSDVLLQRNVSVQRDVDRLIREGKELYENGEYEEAKDKFLEALGHAREREELSEVYFCLSLAYYANGQSEKAKENLLKLFEIQPDRIVDEWYCPSEFVEMFNKTKAESIKLKEKRPVVKVKPGEEKKVKKGGKGFLLVIGVLVAGGAAAALLLSKKGNGGGNGIPVPVYGSIQVNSSPSGAQVYLDGSDTGRTTNTTLTNVSPGSRTVKLVMEGYEDEQRSVSVTAGQTATVSVTLTKPTITVIKLPPGTVWTTGKEVEIKWDTSGSGSSQGVASTGAGLNPLINQGRRALSRFQRRAFQERRFLRSVMKEGRKLEDVDSSGNRGILSRSTSKPQGVSGEISSSVKEGDIVHKRAKDTGNIKRKSIVGRVNIPVSPQISNDKFTPSGNTRVLGLSNVKIELYKGATFKQNIAESTENDGSYLWTVDPSLEDGTDYKVRISSPDDSTVYGESDEFTIEEKSITVTEPTSTAVWARGFPADIGWDYKGTMDNVKIELYKGNDQDPVKEIVSSIPCADKSYTWDKVDETIEDRTDYKVRVSCVSHSEVYDDSPNFKIQELTINAPSNLNATAVLSSQIDLNWKDNSNNEDGFSIERKEGAAGSWAEIATVGADVTTYQDTGLEAETTYYYRVKAYKGAQYSDYSNESNATTGLAGPIDLGAASVSSSQIDLSWTDNSSSEDRFSIERKEEAAGTWAEIDTVGADVTTYQDTGLKDNTTYYYRVRAYKGAQYSDYSNESNATTGLARPTDLGAASVSSSQIDLSWTDNSSSEDGFSIERKEEAAGTWSEIGTVSANVTTYPDTGLEDGTTYYYRVRAYKGTQYSGYSNEANDTIELAAPTDLNATAVSSSQVDLSWTDNSSSEDGFSIERKEGAAGTWAEIATVGADVTTYQDTGLEAETTYYYRIRAYKGTQYSDYSNEASDTTELAAPTDLDATVVWEDQIDLSWTDNSSNEEGFKIERKEGAAGTWAEIDTVGADVTTYQDTGLEDGTTYYYRVRAYKDTQYSDYSNEVNATTISEIEWVKILAGNFEMGDNFNEGDADELPVHTVYLDTYYISKYEVTFEQYDKFCEATGRSKPSDYYWGRGDRPVIDVSWDDAKAFCDWLSGITGQNIHLPTEAQWEKAARGTDQRRYPWGNGSPNSSLANYSNNVGKTMPVGSYPSGRSLYGIHDMAGNVWEWCFDWYDANYYSISPTNNPQGPLSGSDKVARGGGWNFPAYCIRSAYRYSPFPTFKDHRIGFRICKD